MDAELSALAPLVTRHGNIRVMLLYAYLNKCRLPTTVDAIARDCVGAVGPVTPELVGEVVAAMGLKLDVPPLATRAEIWP